MADLTISAGDIPTAAQFNSNMTHTGGAFNSWVSTITQGGSVTFGGTAGYWRAGRQITGWSEWTITGSGSGANDITIALPVASTGSAGNRIVGTATLYDASTSSRWNALLVLASSTTAKLAPASGTTVTYLGSSLFTAGLASPDVICVNLSYETTTG